MIEIREYHDEVVVMAATATEVRRIATALFKVGDYPAGRALLASLERAETKERVRRITEGRNLRGVDSGAYEISGETGDCNGRGPKGGA